AIKSGIDPETTPASGSGAEMTDDVDSRDFPATVATLLPLGATLIEPIDPVSSEAEIAKISVESEASEVDESPPPPDAGGNGAVPDVEHRDGPRHRDPPQHERSAVPTTTASPARDASADAATSARWYPMSHATADLAAVLAAQTDPDIAIEAPGEDVANSDSLLHAAAAPSVTGHPGARQPLPRVMAIANQKGGVGKTTTAVNLGASLADLGYRVLVVDLDPQGNATTGMGVNGRNLDASIYDVLLHDVPIEDVIEPTTLRNLFVVPATIDLAGAEIELVPVFSRELRLRRALDHVTTEFDFIIIDCPPSLGLLTVNGLAAAGEVVVPIQCEYYALEGLGQLLRNVSLVQANLNHQLQVSTIILTMYDARTRLAEQVVNEVRQHFGDRVCRNVVPRTVRLSEAPSFGQPIIVFDSSSRGAIAYRELAKEVSGGTAQRLG
ncbi:MAG: ParA family protein, partial [Acidimicrobiales bacterium]